MFSANYGAPKRGPCADRSSDCRSVRRATASAPSGCLHRPNSNQVSLLCSSRSTRGNVGQGEIVSSPRWQHCRPGPPELQFHQIHRDHTLENRAARKPLLTQGARILRVAPGQQPSVVAHPASSYTRITSTVACGISSYCFLWFTPAHMNPTRRSVESPADAWQI